jgi:hypothetical protein
MKGKGTVQKLQQTAQKHHVSAAGTKFIPKRGQQQPKRKIKPLGLKYRKDNHQYIHAARADPVTLSNSPQQQQRTHPLRPEGQKGYQTTHNKRMIVYETNSKRKS